MSIDRRLLHHSEKPFTLDRTWKYLQDSKPKPRGLWVSCEGEQDWREWCMAEEFCLDDLICVSEITLRPNANMLVVRNPVELLDFDRRYGEPQPPGLSRKHHIDWPQVCRKYDGIIISPYQWSQRLELMWYYGWDCASGCIWNLDAIESVAPVTESLVVERSSA